MARVNLCRVCGTTEGPWAGTNHSLCKNCIGTCPTCGGKGIVHEINFPRVAAFGAALGIPLNQRRKCPDCGGRGARERVA